LTFQAKSGQKSFRGSADGVGASGAGGHNSREAVHAARLTPPPGAAPGAAPEDRNPVPDVNDDTTSSGSGSTSES